MTPRSLAAVARPLYRPARGKRLVAAGIVVAFTAAPLALGAGAQAATPTLTVSVTGHDTGSCQTSACLTIGYAISQAPAGAVIKVGPGTFPEQITITEPLTIQGSGEGKTVIEPTSEPVSVADTDSPEPQFAIVDVVGTTGVKLTGFTVNGAAAIASFPFTCNQDPLGIYEHDASGAIDTVAVTNIQLPASLFGCQGGQGIYVASDSGSTSTVTITNSTVTAYDKNGITCDDPGTTCAVSGSVTQGIGVTPLIAQNGIQVFGATAQLTGNTVTGNSYSGVAAPTSSSGILILNAGPETVAKNRLSGNDVNIYAGEIPAFGLLAAAPGQWSITANTVNDAVNNQEAPFNVPGFGVGDGIQIDSTSNDVDVNGNTVNGAAEYGVGLYGAANAAVNNNAINHAYDGVYVGGPGSVAGLSSAHDTVALNGILFSGNDGILADTTSNHCAFNVNVISASGHALIENRGTANSFLLNLGAPPVVAGPVARVLVGLARIFPME